MKEKSLIAFFMVLAVLLSFADVAARHSRFGGITVVLTALVAIFGPVLYWERTNKLVHMPWISPAALSLFLSVFSLDHFLAEEIEESNPIFENFWGWLFILTSALFLLILFVHQRLRHTLPKRAEEQTNRIDVLKQ